MDVEDQEPDPCAGYPGMAEQTSELTPTDFPQRRAALCSTMPLQEPLTCKPHITYGLFHTAATAAVCFFTFNTAPEEKSSYITFCAV